MLNSDDSEAVIKVTTEPGVRDHFKTIVLLLLLAYLLAYIIPIAERPLSIPDETRYAEIPREMLTTGNWVVPRLDDIRYFEKPILGYWLNAVSIGLFGENNFAVRLPSALSMGLSAWFIWFLLIRSGYDRRTALTAAAIFLTSFGVLLLGTVAILDTPFTMFLTGAMVLFYLAADSPEDISRQRRYLLFSGIMFGLAFLTKGFLAFALPGIILLPYILIRKQYNLLWRSGWVLLLAVVTILPWAIAIHLQEPDYWRYFIWEEHIRRFLAPDAQHASPAYFYLMVLPAMTFPWFGFLPAAIAGYRLKTNKSSLITYLVLWFAMPFIFFSISKGKLATYILPCLIPAAVLITFGLVEYLQARRQRWFVLGIVINTLLLGLLFGALLYQEYFSDSVPIYTHDELPKLIAMLSSLLLSTMLMFTSGFFRAPYKRLVTIFLSAGVLLPAMNFLLPASFLANKSPDFIIKHVVDKVDDNTILVSDGNVIRSVAWTFKRNDIYLLYSGELGYGLSYDDSKQKLIGIKGLKTLLEKQQAGEIKKEIAVFCEEPCPKKLTELLGPHARQMSNQEFAVWLTHPEK